MPHNVATSEDNEHGREMQARAGDIILLRGGTGHQARRALVVEVQGKSGEPPYLVRWIDDERETLFFPGAGCTVEAVDGRAHDDGVFRP